MKKFYLIASLLLLVTSYNTYSQTYYRMWRGNGNAGAPEYIANSSTFLGGGYTGIMHVAGGNTTAVTTDGKWYIINPTRKSADNIKEFINYGKASDNIFMVDGISQMRKLIITSPSAKYNNIQLYNTDKEAYLEANGDDAGLHLKSNTAYKIYIHDQVGIGTIGYDKKIVSGASLTVSGGVFIGPKNFTGSYNITSKLDKYLLWVQKGIVSENYSLVKVADWSDHVFNTDYLLRPLSEVETFIKENNHLPDVPSEKEIVEDGYNIHDMNKIFMQKIEELTLYVIQQQKEIEKLKEELKQ